jgi:hypothetical protein
MPAAEPWEARQDEPLPADPLQLVAVPEQGLVLPQADSSLLDYPQPRHLRCWNAPHECVQAAWSSPTYQPVGIELAVGLQEALAAQLAAVQQAVDLGHHPVA